MGSLDATAPVLSFRTEDPDELSGKIAPIAPGVRAEGVAARAFDIRVRAWVCGGVGLLEYGVEGGRAHFPEHRSYLAVGVTHHGAVEFRQGPSSLRMGPGDLHVLRPGVPAELAPLESSQLVGITLDTALVEAHRAEPGERQRTRGGWPLRGTSTSEHARRVVAYLDWILRELRSPTSLLRGGVAAGEVVESLAALVAAACGPPGAEPRATRSALAARAEELLAAQVGRPVSLVKVASELGTSVRTLSRTFHERRGMSPMAFLRRRRLEAAHHDLFVAERGELRVTDVALRYGFAHLGRFAVDYRRTFGERPSETLAT